MWENHVDTQIFYLWSFFFLLFFFKYENINLDCFLQRDLTKSSKSNVKSGLLNSTVSHQWWFNRAALAQRVAHLRGSLVTQWTRGNFLQKTVNILSTFLLEFFPGFPLLFAFLWHFKSFTMSFYLILFWLRLNIICYLRHYCFTKLESGTMIFFFELDWQLILLIRNQT